MTSPLAFFFGLAVMAAIVYALMRLKEKDLTEAAAAVGLPRVKDVGRKRTTPEGWQCTDVVVARGARHGIPTMLINRTIPKVFTPRAERIASQFTVIALPLAVPPPATFRLQPAGWTRSIEAITKSVDAVSPTGDAAFDAVWNLYTDSTAATLLVLTPALRAALVTFRNTHVPEGPKWAQAANSAFVLGTFLVTADEASYGVYGSATGKTGTHVAGAHGLLAQLAGLTRTPISSTSP